MAVAAFDPTFHTAQTVVPLSPSITLQPEGTSSPTFTVTPRLTLEQVNIMWQSMQTEDLSMAYADGFPESPQRFLDEVQRGSRQPLLGLCNNQVAGLYWLHDILERADGSPMAAWTGAYFLPAYRGRAAKRLWQESCRAWETQGIAHFFVATHIANRRSQAFITRGMHFQRVGVYRRFTSFQGHPTDVVIYCRHPADTELAWQCARKRASYLLPATA